MAQFHEHDLVANKFMDKKHMDKVLQKSSYKTEEALFAAIGFGEIGAITIFNRLTEDERREEERAKARAEAEELVKGGEVKVENKKDTLKVRHEGGVVIQGASGLLIRIAKCCNPVPGDEIVGYITKGRGVAIHRRDCMNLRAQDNYEQRLIDVEWEDNNTTKDYIAHIDIYGLNRAGLLNDILQVLSNTAKMISTVNIHIHNNIFNLLNRILIIILLHICKANKNHRIGSLQLAIFLLFPNGKSLKKVSSFCILSWKKTVQHTHIQCFSKSPRTGNKGNIICIFPPLPDEIRFINIKIVVFS